MQTHTILIILGAVLLLAGVMGGGLTLKEMKLPSLDRYSRVLAGIVGAAFIVGGIYLEREARAPQAATPEPPRVEIPRVDPEAEARAKARAEQEARARARAKAEEEASAKAKAEEEARARARAEEEARAKARREKQQQEADFTRRALLAPKSNAWVGTFRIYDPKTGNVLVRGELSFGPTTYSDRIAYARLRVDQSTLRQLPKGRVEATDPVWGFMGGAKDSAISLAFGKAADYPILVFNKLTKDAANGYLELRGVLFLTQGGKNQVVAHASASCRAR
jgi:hypothetical protein